MDTDKRRHARINTALETIYFKEEGETEGDEADRMHYFGTITDMSKGGVGMTVTCPHDVNEKLWLEGIGDSSVPLPGIVRWVQSRQEEEYRIGIQFLSEAA